MSAMARHATSRGPSDTTRPHREHDRTARDLNGDVVEPFMIASPVNPGEIVASKYVVERLLGQGGMGVVVAARHLELDQRVAIKFLVSDADVNALERFMREAKAAALVKSEHACRVSDFGRLESGEPYIVMEYLDGCDLADKLEAEGPQPVNDVVSWIVQACDALSSAHAQGIVHRDLKPANLFLQNTTDGPPTLKVLDFGISKLSTSGKLTSTAVLMGSPFYMSPEQLESSRDVDQRSDIWSLGVVLYELLTGVAPFMGETIVQLVVQAREREPDPPSRLRPGIPSAIEEIIARCLAKAPANRFQNVNELVRALAPHAPSEVHAIAAKLTKRAGRASDPAFELSKTVETDPRILQRGSQKTRRDTPRSRSDDAVLAKGQSEVLDGRTIAPVQTTTARERGRRARTVVLAGALGLVGLLVLCMIALRRPAPVVSALPDHTPPVLASEPPIETAHPSVTISAASAPIPSPPPAIASSAPPRLPRALRPAASASAHVATSATEVPSAAPPPSLTGKKRGIDRDYEN